MMAYRDLRDFMQALADEGDLLTVPAALNPRFEMSAALKLVNDGPALLFENITGYPGQRVVGNVLGHRRRVAKLMGVAESELVERFIERKGQTVEPQVLTDGPVKEVVQTGGVDLPSLLPALTYHEKDALVACSGLS